MHYFCNPYISLIMVSPILELTGLELRDQNLEHMELYALSVLLIIVDLH